jgi:hypothetical protein
LAKKLANKDKYRPSCGVPEPRLVPKVREWCVLFILVGGVSLCLEVIHRIDKVVGVLGLGVVSLLYVPLLVANMSMGGTITVLGPRGAMDHGLPFVVHVVLQGDVWVFHRGEIG